MENEKYNLKIFTTNIEAKAKEQIELLMAQEAFKNCKVRIMPDVHAGAGCVIGFTADLGNKVIPNVVGVDIGCGMTWVQTDIKLGEIDLAELDKIIHDNIPSGMNIRDVKIESKVDISALKCFSELRNKDEYLERSMGTLGGGNHFIEVDKDQAGFLYFIIHSGSRNLGKQICEIYQKKAVDYCSYKEEMQAEKRRMIEMLKSTNQQKLIPSVLKEIESKYDGLTKLPEDLCYIEDSLREDYLYDMRLCQKWASANRKEMLNIILDHLTILGKNSRKFIFHETIHNYIGDDNIVRKGAISAYEGETVLIPMNMKDGCIIAIGKGNVDWNNSAPHGAGRIMSRNEAKAKLSLSDYEKEMKNIFTTSVCPETIDEAPDAYKPMQEIIDNIKDTVHVAEIIKPIYNFKAKGD